MLPGERAAMPHDLGWHAFGKCSSTAWGVLGAALLPLHCHWRRPGAVRQGCFFGHHFLLEVPALRAACRGTGFVCCPLHRDSFPGGGMNGINLLSALASAKKSRCVGAAICR